VRTVAERLDSELDRPSPPAGDCRLGHVDRLSNVVDPLMAQLRVLVVTPMYPLSDRPTRGAFVRDQVEALRRLGVEVDVLNFDGRRGVLKYLIGGWHVFALTSTRRYHVVHAHYGFAGLVARCQFRSPVVVTFHGSDVNLRTQRPLSRLAATLADQVIVTSPVLASLLQQPRAEVIPCGVDLSQFRPIPKVDARRALGLDPSAPTVLFPGSPGRSVKRFDRFQAALELLPGPVAWLTLESVHRERVPLYMNAADCVVLTSDSEGSPVVVREALACNTPVVSVDVGDVRDWLTGVRPGAIVGRSARDLADAIGAVLRTGKRSNGRERATTFDADVVARRVIDTYQRAVSARHDALKALPKAGS
jgi:teichuronic acid biosynthesis glycosyltransferase TuaC